MEKVEKMKLGNIHQKYIIIEILKYVFIEEVCLTYLFYLNR